jgi:hypothetical protein
MRILKLLLPALIPSWRFFDVIGPSPRIEYALLVTPEALPQWEVFRPRPASLSVIQMLKQLTWNPRWNEDLFLVSCAERLIYDQTDHSYREIMQRIRGELCPLAALPFFQFRITVIQKIDGQLQKEVAFISPVIDHKEQEKS